MKLDAYKPPYMEWYVKDFWSQRVRRMRPLARLMYRSLLQESWHCERPGYLPANDTDLLFLADAPDEATWEKYRGEVLSMFERTDDGNYCHPRVTADYDRLIQKHLAKAAAGQKGGAARAQLEHRQNGATSQLERSSSNAPPERSSSIQIQIQDPSPDGGNGTANTTPTEFNATEVAWALCKREGWSSHKIPLALADAITHVAAGHESPDFKAIGEDLVRRWYEHRATGKFPHDPGTFFSGAHYEEPAPVHTGPPLVTDSKKLVEDMLKNERDVCGEEGLPWP